MEISHVRVMKDYVRMFSSGDGEHLLVNVQPFDVIVAFEVLDVVARSTCYIEQGITRPRFVSPNYAMDLSRLLSYSPCKSRSRRSIVQTLDTRALILDK